MSVDKKGDLRIIGWSIDVKWSQSRHPTSGMTAINFDIEEE